MKEYLRDAGQVMTEQKTSLEGLSSAEASERLQKHGLNKLAEGKKESIFVKFLNTVSGIFLCGVYQCNIKIYFIVTEFRVSFFYSVNFGWCTKRTYKIAYTIAHIKCVKLHC